MPKTKVRCSNCDTEFLQWPSRLKKENKWGIFCSRPCVSQFRARYIRGLVNPTWAGGWTITREGYVMVYAPWHPKNHKGTVRLHRLLVESRIGRYLQDDEHVHHVDGNQENNHWDNLMIVSPKEHAMIHAPDTVVLMNEAREKKRKETNVTSK